MSKTAKKPKPPIDWERVEALLKKHAAKDAERALIHEWPKR